MESLKNGMRNGMKNGMGKALKPTTVPPSANALTKREAALEERYIREREAEKMKARKKGIEDTDGQEKNAPRRKD